VARHALARAPEEEAAHLVRLRLRLRLRLRVRLRANQARWKRKPLTGMSRKHSMPKGKATAMYGLRRPQREVVLSESRPMIAPVAMSSALTIARIALKVPRLILSVSR